MLPLNGIVAKVYNFLIINKLFLNLTTLGAHQVQYGGGAVDFFLAKFDTTGKRIWCTFYGGSAVEYHTNSNHLLATDGSNIYMCGHTMSHTGISTPISHQPSHSGGAFNAFLVKFNKDGVRQWATYYGGAMGAYVGSITTDLKGDVYLSGRTQSLDGIATSNSYQMSNAGGRDDAFLVKFDTNGVRQWATYFGGPEFDRAVGVICDQDLNVYLSGDTESNTGIATPGSHQPIFGGQQDGFLAKFNTLGERQWSTYYGGTALDNVYNITADTWGNVYICGTTFSTTGIASSNAFASQYAGSQLRWYGDGFFTAFNNKGERAWGSYFGGTGDDAIFDITTDNQGSLYMCGTTMAQDIATPGSHMDTFPIFGPLTLFQGFMTKFCLSAPIEAIHIKGPDTLCAHKIEQYTAATLPDVEEYTWELPAGWQGSRTGSVIRVTSGVESGVIKLQIKRCGELSEWVEFPVYVLPPDPAIVTVDGYVLGTADAYASYQWLLNGVVIPGATARNYTVTQNGNYAVVTITAEGCLDTSTVYEVSNVSIDNVSLTELISIYPNPGFGSLLHISSPIPVSVGLYSLDGHLLKFQGRGATLNIETLTPGMYLIRLSDIDGRLLKTVKWTKW